ncbi:MAG TPA: hypothetical protein VFA32_04260 [Dehalococcoidia bacterium]|nr:hypothetical protein [Dehalococcoidia bacterium]
MPAGRVWRHGHQPRPVQVYADIGQRVLIPPVPDIADRIAGILDAVACQWSLPNIMPLVVFPAGALTFFVRPAERD